MTSRSTRVRQGSCRGGVERGVVEKWRSDGSTRGGACKDFSVRVSAATRPAHPNPPPELEIPSSTTPSPTDAVHSTQPHSVQALSSMSVLLLRLTRRQPRPLPFPPTHTPTLNSASGENSLTWMRRSSWRRSTPTCTGEEGGLVGEAGKPA